MTWNVSWPAILVQARLVTIGKQYEEASADLGCTQFQTMRRVMLPLLTPAIFASAILVFSGVIDDFVIVDLLSSNASNTPMSVIIYSTQHGGNGGPALNALATVMLLLSFVVARPRLRRLPRHDQGPAHRRAAGPDRDHRRRIGPDHARPGCCLRAPPERSAAARDVAQHAAEDHAVEWCDRPPVGVPGEAARLEDRPLAVGRAPVGVLADRQFQPGQARQLHFCAQPQQRARRDRLHPPEVQRVPDNQVDRIAAAAA